MTVIEPIPFIANASRTGRANHTKRWRIMRSSTLIAALAVAVVTSTFVAACGGSDPGGPAGPTAAVSGVVKTAAGAFVEGASVKIGSASATTGEDGRFELQNVPVGSATITATAPDFEPRSESVSLIAGTNVHDVVLTQTTFAHQDFVAYLPAGKAEYKVAIVFLPGPQDPSTGDPLDSRGLVRGASGALCSIWCLATDRTEVRSRALALAGGNVALVGMTTLVDEPASYEALLSALSELGTQSLHPELANIPLILIGHSMGGCTAYGFSRVHAARVAGFMTMKGACHTTGDPAAATSVPGYFLIGGTDAPERKANLTAVFDAGRAASAPWAVSVDASGHDPIADLGLMFDWINAVLAGRLPATAGAPLRAMPQSAGWLANQSSRVISTYACYSGAHSGASWLPSLQTALKWQGMAGGTGVTASCEGGEWEIRTPLIIANSESALAEANGKLYFLGGYPASRVTSRAVQVYDIATNSWTLGPQLPQPNNHGMAASVNGKVYLIGGQTSDVSDQGYQNTVYELNPATGIWATKAPMPTARGGGLAVAHGGKIYVAGGRPPRGNDFAAYDPATNSWEVLPNLPTQRNHITGAAINGRIHFAGGRLGHGLSLEKTTAHEVYDPETRTWTTAAPMLRGRSGMNGVVARGCFHVWGGEEPAGMMPDHDYYDPRTDKWLKLPNMPAPIHGIYGSAFVDGLIWVPGGGIHIGGNHGSLQNQVYRPGVSCQ